jgi:Glycosyltransferase family 92
MALRDTAFMRAVNVVVRAPGVLRAIARDRWARGREPHYLSICAIFKNEARYLEEWIEFHRGVGVSHFYLYDNESSDDPLSVLCPWIEKGLVTLVAWPGRARQRHAYMHCIRHNWSATRWLAFLDIDEFLFSPSQVDIRLILSRFEHFPALFVYWQVFGSSGHVVRPSDPVVEAYNMRERAPRKPSGKSIVNPRFVRRIPNAHNFALWIGAARDTSGKQLDYRGFFDEGHVKTPPFDVLRINHYWSRSLEELAEKVERGDAFFPNVPRELEEHLDRDKLFNEVEDTSILPIWSSIKPISYL